MKNRGRDFNVNFETREDDGKKIIEGYFVRFDSEYELWGSNFETIDSGAFDNTLNKDIVCLWNHDSSVPLGRTSNGTLKLKVDNLGLYGTVEINERDSYALDAYERIKRGDVGQCSFGFEIVREEYIQHPDGRDEFRIKEVDLWEVSPVTFPAYKETSISARKNEIEAITAKRELDSKKEKLRERIRNVKNIQVEKTTRNFEK